LKKVVYFAFLGIHKFLCFYELDTKVLIEFNADSILQCFFTAAKIIPSAFVRNTNSYDDSGKLLSLI